MKSLVLPLLDALKLAGYKHFLWAEGNLDPGASMMLLAAPAKPEDCYIAYRLSFYQINDNVFDLLIDHPDTLTFIRRIREDMIAEGIELPRWAFITTDKPFKVIITNVSNIPQTFGVHVHAIFCDRTRAEVLKKKVEEIMREVFT